MIGIVISIAVCCAILLFFCGVWFGIYLESIREKRLKKGKRNGNERQIRSV